MYDFNVKKKVVEAYLRGEGGYKKLSKKFNISESVVYEWIKKYKKNGFESLMQSKYKKYTSQYMLSIVKLYLEDNKSLEEIALDEGIPSASTVYNWVQKYKIQGGLGLKTIKKGRPKMIKKPKISKDNLEEVEKYISDLEENLHLKTIEIEYLKALRKLKEQEK